MLSPVFQQLPTQAHASHTSPQGVLCTIGMSMWSGVFGFTQSTPCAPCQITKSPHMHTGSTAFFPWLVHHYVPTIHLPINLWQYSTLHLHLHTCSKPSCTATFGCACPSMFPIAWRTFHHKPALVASFILWLEYFLCAHHTNFPNFQLLDTCTDPPGPAFLPTWPFMACAPPCTPFHCRRGETQSCAPNQPNQIH